jgi:predicted TIM-barrel fold metal-dependent hydrolase
MAKFVLVHGAFQGSWVYARVARKLREAGHDVYVDGSRRTISPG